MSEHYTKNTLEVTAYCKRCGKNTQHRVDGGRKGPCMDAAHGTNPNIYFRVRFLSDDKTRILKTDCAELGKALTLLEYSSPGTKRPAGSASLWAVEKHLNGPDTERELTGEMISEIRRKFQEGM